MSVIYKERLTDGTIVQGEAVSVTFMDDEDSEDSRRWALIRHSNGHRRVPADRIVSVETTQPVAYQSVHVQKEIYDHHDLSSMRLGRILNRVEGNSDKSDYGIMIDGEPFTFTAPEMRDFLNARIHHHHEAKLNAFRKLRELGIVV